MLSPVFLPVCWSSLEFGQLTGGSKSSWRVSLPFEDVVACHSNGQQLSSQQAYKPGMACCVAQMHQRVLKQRVMAQTAADCSC